MLSVTKRFLRLQWNVNCSFLISREPVRAVIYLSWFFFPVFREILRTSVVWDDKRIRKPFLSTMLKVERKYRRVCKYIYIYISFPFCHEILTSRFVYSRQANKTRSLYSVRSPFENIIRTVSCHAKRESNFWYLKHFSFSFFFFSFRFTFLRRHDKETTTERDIFFSQLQSNASSVKINRVSSYRVFEISRRLIKITNSMRFHKKIS